MTQQTHLDQYAPWDYYDPDEFNHDEWLDYIERECEYE